MKYKELSFEQKEEFLDYFNQDKEKQEITLEVCEEYNISPRTAYYWKERIENESKVKDKPVDLKEKYDIVSDDKKIIHKLKEENKALKSSLNTAKSEIHTSDEIRDLVLGVSNVNIPKPDIPEWLNKKSTNKSNIVPVLCISDIHVGEVVLAEEVNYVNEYNSKIARERVLQCVDDFIDIYINKMSNYEYDGCVVLLPGDNLTGNLHDLSDSNDLSPIDQVIETISILQEALLRLEKAFKSVACFGCSGNHGRLQPKGYTKTKGRYNNSLEKIVYHFLESNLKDNNVSVITSPSDIVRFSINGKRCQLEHGDSIKGGASAIAGPVTGWERGRLKKSSVASSTNNKFDILIIGHFHTHHIKENFIVCNSTKGYDEYCQMIGIPYAPPGCTSFSVNNNGQIIFATDIQSVVRKIEKPKKHIEIF